jgi:hypothetical protein
MYYSDSNLCAWDFLTIGTHEQGSSADYCNHKIKIECGTLPNHSNFVWSAFNNCQFNIKFVLIIGIGHTYVSVGQWGVCLEVGMCVEISKYPAGIKLVV